MHAVCTLSLRRGSGGGSDPARMCTHCVRCGCHSAFDPQEPSTLQTKEIINDAQKTLHLDCILPAMHSGFNTEDRKKRNRRQRRGDAEHVGRGGGKKRRRQDATEAERGGGDNMKWEGKREHGHIDEVTPVRHLMAVRALWLQGKDPMTEWGPTAMR